MIRCVRVLRVLTVALIAQALCSVAGEEPPKAEAAEKPKISIGVQREEKAPPPLPPEPEKPSPETPFSEPRMGVAFTIPEGFRRLSEEEYRAVVSRLSEHLGQEAGQRMMQQAPLYFKGQSLDGRLPPNFSVSISASSGRFDPAKLEEYRERIRHSLEKSKVRHGAIAVKLIPIGSQQALRADHELFSIEDNSKQFVTMLLVPGGERQCDIVFNYSKGQEIVVERAFEKVASTFKFAEASAGRNAGKRDWGRVFLWTGGAFVFGIGLSFILRALNRAAGPVEEKK